MPCGKRRRPFSSRRWCTLRLYPAMYCAASADAADDRLAHVGGDRACRTARRAAPRPTPAGSTTAPLEAFREGREREVEEDGEGEAVRRRGRRGRGPRGPSPPSPRRRRGSPRGRGRSAPEVAGHLEEVPVDRLEDLLHPREERVALRRVGEEVRLRDLREGRGIAVGGAREPPPARAPASRGPANPRRGGRRARPRGTSAPPGRRRRERRPSRLHRGRGEPRGPARRRRFASGDLQPGSLAVGANRRSERLEGPATGPA